MNRKDKKIDLRVQKTYQQLEDAFKLLSVQKSLETITIQELCDAAGIRRTTFYQHFEDKHDFLGWFLLRIQETYLKQHPISYAGVKGIEDFCLRAAKTMIAFMKENRSLIDTLSNVSLPRISFLVGFHIAYIEELKQFLKRYSDDKSILPLFPLDMISTYYIGAVISSVLWWYRSMEIYREQNYLEDLEEILRHSPRALEDKSLHLNP